ncbi:8187_t:CDS:2, partial [Diversispora eburnea]
TEDTNSEIESIASTIVTKKKNELPTFESSEIIPVNEQESPKKIKITRHYPSKEEKDILETLFAYDVRPSDTVIDSTLSNLLTYWDGWTKKMIRDAWESSIPFLTAVKQTTMHDSISQHEHLTDIQLYGKINGLAHKVTMKAIKNSDAI